MLKGPTCSFLLVSRWFVFSESLLHSSYFSDFIVWLGVSPKIQAYTEHRKTKQYAIKIGKPATLGCYEQIVPQYWKQFQDLRFWEVPTQARIGTFRDPVMLWSGDKWQPGDSSHSVLSHWNQYKDSHSPHLSTASVLSSPPQMLSILLTSVFNLSPLVTSTVCSLGKTETPLPSLLLTPQRKGQSEPRLLVLCGHSHWAV